MNEGERVCYDLYLIINVVKVLVANNPHPEHLMRSSDDRFRNLVRSRTVRKQSQLSHHTDTHLHPHFRHVPSLVVSLLAVIIITA